MTCGDFFERDRPDRTAREASNGMAGEGAWDRRCLGARPKAE